MNYFNDIIKSIDLNNVINLNRLRPVESIAKRLKRLRVQNGLTQAEVARLIEISPSTYRDWEYGKQIKGEPYEQLAHAFSVTVTYLITGKNSQGDDILEKLRDVERAVGSIRKIAASL